MKINELILEQEQLDELNLKGLGTGLGKAAGAVAGGVVQGAKNFWSGAKQGYPAGQQALAPDATTNPAGTTGAAGQFSQSGAPVQQAPNAQQTAQAPTAPAGGAAGQFTQQSAPTQQGASAGTAQQGRVGVPAGKKAVDQAVATVQSVRSDRRPQVIQYAKQKVDALAGQAAKPAAPAGPTQAELDADNARMATGTNEGFHSKFLGMMI